MTALLRLSFRALLGCALLIALPACDSGNDDDEEEGGGGGGASGISLDGSAYAIDGSVAGTGFVLYLFDETVAFESVETYRGDFLFMFVEDIAPGTYTVSATSGGLSGSYGVYGEDANFSGEEDPSDFDIGFFSNAGSITISSASTTQVRGSYDLQMLGAGGTRTLRGSFTAQLIEGDE